MGVANRVALMSTFPRYSGSGSADVAGIRVAGVGSDGGVGPARRVGTTVTVATRMAVHTVATVDALSITAGRRGHRTSGCR